MDQCAGHLVVFAVYHKMPLVANSVCGESLDQGLACGSEAREKSRMPVVNIICTLVLSRFLLEVLQQNTFLLLACL